ncbi:MAG: ATP-grasp domain-containing protein [Bacillota bacterium]
MNNDSVVITDVRYRMSLPIIRSLGKKGIRVTAAEKVSTPSASALGFYSKYTADRLSLSDSEKNEKIFITDLVNYASNVDSKPVLIPVGIHSLMAVSRNIEVLSSSYDFIVPNTECIDIANDTYRLLGIAEKSGIPIPETTTLNPNESITELSARIKYPAVVKYRQGELLKLGPEKRYRIVNDTDAFVEAFTYMHGIQEFPLVQEYIKGNGFGVSAIFDKDSNPTTVFCHMRLREYPVTGGPSCFCESIWDKRLVDYAVTLLKELKWTGVAMVEFKGELNGKLALMEINPRIWGSFPLTTAAGADFPMYIYNAAKGMTEDFSDDKALEPNYKIGKKMRFILQDLMSFKGYFARSSNKPAFLFSYIIDLLNPFVAEGVFDISDLKSSIQYFRQAFRKYNG